MRKRLRSLWEEPRPPQPTTSAWWDKVLVAIIAPMALFEGLFREDLSWRPVMLVLAVGLPFTLLWRREHAFVVFVYEFDMEPLAG